MFRDLLMTQVSKQIIIYSIVKHLYYIKHLSAKKSKVKVTLCQRASSLPALPSLITSQFQSLGFVVSFSDRNVFSRVPSG